MTMTISGSNGVTFPDSTIQNSSSGMILLGTLTTTSGTTQVLSDLNLTTYKQLFISIDRVSHSNTAASYNFRLESFTFTSLIANTSFLYGIIIIDITNNGALISTIGDSTTSGVNITAGGSSRFGESGITTATTSLTFDWSTASTFDSGTIKVYGVK